MRVPRKLLLTRPGPQSRAFAADLAARLPGRFAPVIAPLIEIEPLPGPVDLAGAQGLIFTSANGVEQLAARSANRDLPAWCVGEITAAAARAAGFAAIASDGDVASLATRVAAAYVPGNGAFLHIRGRHAAGDLIGRLAALGIPARAEEIYDQKPRPLSPDVRRLLERGEIAVVALFSPRTARLFATEAEAARWNLAPLTAVSMSAAADEALGASRPGRQIVAARPGREGMLDALASA